MQVSNFYWFRLVSHLGIPGNWWKLSIFRMKQTFKWLSYLWEFMIMIMLSLWTGVYWSIDSSRTPKIFGITSFWRLTSQPICSASWCVRPLTTGWRAPEVKLKPFSLKGLMRAKSNMVMWLNHIQKKRSLDHQKPWMLRLNVGLQEAGPGDWTWKLALLRWERSDWSWMEIEIVPFSQSHSQNMLR